MQLDVLLLLLLLLIKGVERRHVVVMRIWLGMVLLLLLEVLVLLRDEAEGIPQARLRRIHGHVHRSEGSLVSRFAGLWLLGAVSCVVSRVPCVLGLVDVVMW